MCHYFFDPAYRNDWETTLEDCQILEEISKDTLVILQTHKRIWPANQRDALFWSHMRKVESLEAGAKDAWIVCNHSTDSPSYPVRLLSYTNIFHVFPNVFNNYFTARQSRKVHKNLPYSYPTLSNLY